jgi:predicted nucleotidyltransferase
MRRLPRGGKMHVEMCPAARESRPSLEELRENIRALLEAEPTVRLAYVFGSTARGDARPTSDVDVGVVLAPGGRRELLAEDLERALGCRVDVVDLRGASPVLLHEVLRDGVPVLCRDEREQADFETRAIAEYLDTQHLRDVQESYLRQRVEERLGRSR